MGSQGPFSAQAAPFAPDSMRPNTAAELATPSTNDLFAVFDIPAQDPTDTATPGIQARNGRVSSNAGFPQRSSVKMDPPANANARSLSKPSSHRWPLPSAPQSSHPTPSNQASPATMPIRSSPSGLRSDARPISARGKRLFINRHTEITSAPATKSTSIVNSNSIIDHLSKIDTKYGTVTPDLAALEKVIDAKVQAMAKTDPKRKLLMEQFLDLKQAHIQSETATLYLRVNIAGQVKEEREREQKQEAAVVAKGV